MKSVKYMLAGLLTVALGAGMAFAQDAPAAGRGARRPAMAQDRAPGAGQMMRVENIMRALGTMDLTAEQKDKLAAIRAEFGEKAAPLVDKLKDKSKALADRQQNDPEDAEGIKAMRAEVEENTRNLDAAAAEFQEKATNLLTEDQKKKFQETAQRGPGGGAGGAGMGQGMEVLRNLMQGVLPFDIRALRDLDLTNDQRTQALDVMKQYREAIEKTRLEYEAKFKGLLTDDQKKKYEEIKANPDQGGPGAGAGAGRGGRGAGARGGNRPAPPDAAN